MATAKPKTRLKSAARAVVPQTTQDAARDIKAIGDAQREALRLTAAMNDEIAAITERYQPDIDAQTERVNLLREGVQTYCEAHRDELTNGGKVKTGNFITGTVSWRIRPPSVSVRGADAVIETLKKLGLGRFVRVKEEPNKEAMLNEIDAVRGIAGISVNSGVEDFIVEPFEADTAKAA